jgi:regulator of sigma E protease
MSGDVASLGFVSFVMFAVLLSINLGLINLFPVPMLDGGHLVYYAVEAVRGKPLGERAQEFGLKVGLALVLSLMLFATWNDLVYLKVVDFVKSLFT